MPETSIVKKIYKWEPFTRRPVGSPSPDGKTMLGMA
jgi:hypothetical protein